MNACPVCAAENHHLAVTCRSCGSFLQTRVENVDLFATSWGIIESPSKTFHTIAVARHKNFSFVLAAAAGIPLIFFLFRVLRAGERTEGLLPIIAAALAAGPVAGIVAVALGAGAAAGAAALLRIRLAWRNAFAVFAWALLPAVVAGLVVLPLELLTFGEFLFTSNPGPYLIRPASYVILLILDILCAVWSLFLQFAGLRSLFGAGSWRRAAAVQAAALAVPAAALFWMLRALR